MMFAILAYLFFNTYPFKNHKDACKNLQVE